MAKRWGFGWMGSKNGIARELVNLLPAGECFVDLFAGGCAITHCALSSGKWQRVIANDIKGTAVFFKQAIEGKVENLYEWVSREEFNARKDRDIKVASAWSFGNTGDAYLYSKEIEPLKKALYDVTFGETHEARRIGLHEVLRQLWRYLVLSKAGNKILDSWQEERRVYETLETDEERERFDRMFRKSRRNSAIRETFNRLRGASETRCESFNVLSEQRSLERLKHIERAQAIPIASYDKVSTQKSVEHIEHIDELSSLRGSATCLDVYECDYRDVPIPTGAIVYCDPPYTKTHDYGTSFDTGAFWDWARTRPYPVFVSEYTGADGFTEVWSTDKRCVLASAGKAKSTTERLYVQDRFADEFMPKSEAGHLELFADTEQLEASA